MNIDRAVLAFAAGMLLLSALSVWLCWPARLLLTGSVGLNMLQTNVSGFCPAANVFQALGCKPGQAFR